MKNIRNTTIAALSAFAILLFPGCENSNILTESDSKHQTEKTSVSVVRDTFNEEIEALRTEKFDNISFENLKTYSFPDVSEITTYKISRYEFGNGLTSEQFFENFVTYCDYFAPGKLSKEEIAEKTIVQGDFESGESYYNYKQFLELAQTDDLSIHYISLEISDLYLAYFGHGPYWYIDDTLIKHYKRDAENPPRSPMSVSMIDDDHPIVYYTENTDSTEVYALADGEISIADAAKKVNALLADIAKQCDDDMCEIGVCAVKVIDIGEGCFGYYFTITPVVDGIRYAYPYTASDDGGAYFFEEQDGYGDIGDHAVMIETGKLHSLTNSHGWKDKTPVGVYDSIVPLKTAAENASKLLSGQMGFKARSVTLVYDLKGDSDDLVPCWRFVLESSLNHNKIYHVYVNALTGEARVKAVQGVE
ncbi:MAG: hypothetical protein HDT43_09005 [Ruminococcaceae bacterium]|nr:hypothetical protein [Oscillospiraceae bacterium]